MSSTVSLSTVAPLFGANPMSPLLPSRMSASRIGVRLTP